MLGRSGSGGHAGRRRARSPAGRTAAGSPAADIPPAPAGDILPASAASGTGDVRAAARDWSVLASSPPSARESPDDLVVQDAVRREGRPVVDGPDAVEVGHPAARLLDHDRRRRQVPAVRARPRPSPRRHPRRRARSPRSRRSRARARPTGSSASKPGASPLASISSGDAYRICASAMAATPETWIRRGAGARPDRPTAHAPPPRRRVPALAERGRAHDADDQLAVLLDREQRAEQRARRA